MISGTANIWSKSGPVNLLTITKMLQKIQEKYGVILEKYYLCQYWTQQDATNRESVCHRYHIFQCIFRVFPFFCEHLITYFANIFVEMRIEKMINFPLMQSTKAWI